MSALEEERDRNGEFLSLENFTSRIDGRLLNRRSLENLVKAGALDKLYSDRARLFANVDIVIRYSNATFEERNSNQENLFGEVKLTESESLNFLTTAEWSSLERLKHEFEAMGFYLSAHPLDAYGSTLEKVGVVSSYMIGPTILASNGSGRINLAGIVSASRIRTNQRGNKYAFIQLSDQSGVFEVTAFSEVLSVSQNLLEPGTAVLLRCDAKSEEGNIRLLANRVQALDVAVEKEVKGLLIYVNNEEIVAPLAKILSGNSPGNGHVTITLQSESQEIDVTLPDSYLINAKMRSAVKSLPGVIDVSDL